VAWTRAFYLLVEVGVGKFVQPKMVSKAPVLPCNVI